MITAGALGAKGGGGGGGGALTHLLTPLPNILTLIKRYLAKLLLLCLHW